MSYADICLSTKRKKMIKLNWKDETILEKRKSMKGRMKICEKGELLA